MSQQERQAAPKEMKNFIDEIDKVIERFRQTYAIDTETGKEVDLGDWVYSLRLKFRK